MDLPKVAGKAPMPVNLEEGKKYAWCTCGLSDQQPFCNGAHKGTGFAPKVFEAPTTKTAYMCTCKATTNADGTCNGAHKSL